ncbi:MAG: alpha/beta fold hydrolase [Streptosporangiales bacterium]
MSEVKMDFSRKAMDIGTFQFNFVRTLSLAGTGGAEVAECLLAAGRVKSRDQESWVREWAALAEKVERAAVAAADGGQPVTARQAYLRASNYYRAAMFSLAPSDSRLDGYLTKSRELFRAAAPLLRPPVEPVMIPFGAASLPGYFLTAGQPAQPTLLVVNGGDSTNEEFVHWIGFTCVSRGWNCLVFEGPGQWSARQLHPELPLRPDFEVPVRAAIDYLETREEVDAGRIALAGYSLGAVFAARAAAFEPRICACICDGLITDVDAAWRAVMPALVRNAPPGLFDRLFRAFEKVSPQLAGFANHYRWIFNVTEPHEIFDAWKPYNVNGLAPRIHCPMLLLYGEAELAQTSEQVGRGVLSWLRELTAPLTIRMIGYEDGWAATHCQVGAISTMQATVFDWLALAAGAPARLPGMDLGTSITTMRKYWASTRLEHDVADLERRQQHGPAHPGPSRHL